MKFQFEQIVVAAFTVEARTRAGAEKKAARLFRDGWPVPRHDAITQVVDFYRYLPHGSADASEPEMVVVP